MYIEYIYKTILMAEKKRYVVRNWKNTGIFEDWPSVQPLVSWFSWAKYKSFASKIEAEEAFQKGADEYYQPKKKWNEKDLPFVKKSIAVDAACSSATGIMEYKGIDLVSEKEVFTFSFPEGTNNIGEFLAIVHGLSWLKSEKKGDYSLYSDSRNAIGRVREKKCKTNYSPKDQKLMEIIKRAENRLNTNTYTTEILKRDTENRWEIPADFWRK